MIVNVNLEPGFELESAVGSSLTSSLFSQQVTLFMQQATISHGCSGVGHTVTAAIVDEVFLPLNHINSNHDHGNF